MIDAAGRARFEEGWGVEGLPAENGLTIVEMFDAADVGAAAGSIAVIEEEDLG